MENIKTEFLSRCETINSLFDHIVYMTNKPKSVNTVLILKSSMFVATYNNVEATFYALFEHIHEKIHTTDYNTLSSKIKDLFVGFHFNTIGNVTPETVRKLHESELKFPLLDVYLTKKKIFSGNIDSQKIESVFKSYGIRFYKFKESISSSLLTVKSKRNSIAHGETTLLDASFGYSNTKIRKIIDDCQTMLAKFIDLVDTFITEKSFLRLDKK